MDALNLVITADASPLQSELSGKAVGAVKDFTSTVKTEFNSVDSSTNSLNSTLGSVGASFESVASKSAHAGKSMTSDMVKAEGAWLLFDRTFRLGIDREMMTVLQAYPALTKFLAVLGSTPATLGAILAFAAISRGVEALGKAYKEATEAPDLFTKAMVQSISTTEQQTLRLAVENDQLDRQIAKLEHRPDNRLAESIDEDIAKIGALVAQTEQALTRIDEMMDNSKLHVTAWGASVANAWSLLKGLAATTLGIHGADAMNLVGSDTHQVENVKAETKALENLNKQYTIAMALAGDDPIKKQAVSADQGKKLIDGYTGAIDRLGKAQERLKKDSHLLDTTQGQDVLGDTQLNLIVEQAALRKQVANNAKSDKVSALSDSNEALTQELSRDKAALDAWKSTEEEKVKSTEDATKRAYTAGEITLRQETEALVAAENQRFTILEQFYAKAESLARKRGGPEGQNELTGLQGQQQVASTEHTDKVADIQSGAGERERAQAQSVAQAVIQIDEQVGEARIKQAEQTSKALQALHQQEDQQTTSQLELEAEEEYNVKVAALTKQIDLLKQNSDKNIVEITHLQGQLQVLAITHQTEMASIVDSGRAKELAQQRAANERTLAAEETLNTQRLAQEEQVNNRLLQIGGESTGAWTKKAEQELQSWYSQQSAIYDKMAADIEKFYNNDQAKYAALIQKKEQLDLQYTQKWTAIQQKDEDEYLQWANKMTSGFTTVINSMLDGTNKGSKAWAKMFGTMVTSTVDSFAEILEKRAAHWIAAEAMDAAGEAKSLILHLLGITQQTTANTTADAQRTSELAIVASAEQGIESTANAATVVGDAGVAAAGALAYYSSFAPEIAPAMAAIQFAEVMAYAPVAAFDAGGVVPMAKGLAGLGQHVPILAEAGERVLSNSQTKTFESIASQSNVKNTSNTKQGGDTHIHYAPQINAYDRSGVKSMLRAESDTLLGIVKQGYKDGRLT